MCLSLYWEVRNLEDEDGVCRLASADRVYLDTGFRYSIRYSGRSICHFLFSCVIYVIFHTLGNEPKHPPTLVQNMMISSVPCWFAVTCALALVFAQVTVTATCGRPPRLPQDAPLIPRSCWTQPTRAEGLKPVLAVRGGAGGTANTEEEAGEPPLYRSSSWSGSRNFLQQPPPGGHNKEEKKASERIEKIAENLKAKRDDIAADVRARGEALAADLKAKQEKITDEVLRDRSPEAFGELGGHHSYDSATAVRRSRVYMCV